MLLRGLNPKSIGGHCVDTYKVWEPLWPCLNYVPKKVFESPSILILDLMLGMASVKMGSIRNIFLQFFLTSPVSFCSIGRLDMDDLF